MVMNKSELIASLQGEVRILLHLASKVDRTMLDYRPTPKQRSTIELLRYLSMMGPTFVRYTLSGSQDPDVWNEAAKAADARDFEQTLAAIAAQHDEYASYLENVSDVELRVETDSITGGKISRGSALVNLVLCGCAAYRTQLFLYLKACGRDELGTMNLWAGIDPPAAATTV
jgi:hypothetical protein